MNSEEKPKSVQQEIVIDIHLKHLKLKVKEKTPLRVVWSRGKKQAKSQVKFLNEGLDIAVFDEKFQINTVLDLDQENGNPVGAKMSKMTVQLDKSRGGTHIGEVEFDMTDFTYGEYKYRTLKVKKSEANDILDFNPEVTVLEIGLKATRQDGLVQKRMSEMKKQMDSSIKDIMKKKMPEGDLMNILQGAKSQEMFQSIVKTEVDKMMQVARDKMRENE
jgi:hypothetical protein